MRSPSSPEALLHLLDVGLLVLHRVVELLVVRLIVRCPPLQEADRANDALYDYPGSAT